MPRSGDVTFNLRSDAARSIDALVLTCVAAVAGLGLLVLSATSPELPQTGDPVVYAAVSAPHADASRLPPQFYPWRAPEPFAPPVPEAAPPAAPISRQPAFLTRLADPHNDRTFRPAAYDNNNSHYGAHWREQNASPTSSGTLLTVRRTPGLTVPFTSSEMSTGRTHGYGRYEVIMRPARGEGLVSAFFTYTGPWFGDPHDEIDIEFLGKDTTRVFLNYFRNGRRGHHATIELPFDAAEADRLYAFEWTPETITWFIEGVPVYSSAASESRHPVAAGRIYMNVWPGAPSIHGWTGQPRLAQPAGAHFSCVSFVPMGGTGPACADVYTPPGQPLSP
ncbi:family 16 glycosylhydrolase [Hyphomonas sp.]|uniref:family 16 glycosylhydrolase n=1 Tax=Hyphomonas sp. TaxID=87 RepID=UPI00391A9178